MMFTRDRGGSVDLSDGTGGIVRLINVGDCLEVFKVDRIFKMTMPNHIDPEKNIPDLKPYIQKIRKGTSNKIVARNFLQLHDLVTSIPLQKGINIENIILHLRNGRDFLLNCEDAYTEVLDKQKKCVADIESNHLGETVSAYSEFPTIDNLNSLTSSFLINAKKFIIEQTHIFNEFFDARIREGRVDKVINWLKKHRNDEQDFITQLTSMEEMVSIIIDFRNGQEHPSTANPLVVNDFTLGANKLIIPPTWYTDASKQTGIVGDMRVFIDFLINLSEILCINSIFCNVSDFPLPLRLHIKHEDEINPDCPVKYVIVSECGTSKYIMVGNQIGFDEKFRSKYHNHS